GFTYVPFNDSNAVEQAMSSKTAAVMVELIQGEGGLHVAQGSYLRDLRELCRQYDALLIFDEVQTGVGRTGTLFAYEQFGIKPDIMTLGKGLGGGVPIGACLATDEAAKAFSPSSHGSTFGGNPLACTAASTVLNALLEAGLLDHSRRMGDYMTKGLVDCMDRLASAKEVRGLGLLQGMELTIEGQPVVMDCLARGVLINRTMDRVLRFAPPLIISQPEIDRMLEVLSQVLSKRGL
ncbi:MAG: aminotransferase class III-fold pyridoxal phosphate-dependent enzyme, partial [Nitrospiraceae bacterium]